MFEEVEDEDAGGQGASCVEVLKVVLCEYRYEVNVADDGVPNQQKNKHWQEKHSQSQGLPQSFGPTPKVKHS